MYFIMEFQSREFTILLIAGLGVFIYVNFLRKSLNLDKDKIYFYLLKYLQFYIFMLMYIVQKLFHEL